MTIWLGEFTVCCQAMDDGSCGWMPAVQGHPPCGQPGVEWMDEDGKRFWLCAEHADAWENARRNRQMAGME
jgi:hypothetical protein